MVTCSFNGPPTVSLPFSGHEKALKGSSNSAHWSILTEIFFISVKVGKGKQAVIRRKHNFWALSDVTRSDLTSRKKNPQVAAPRSRGEDGLYSRWVFVLFSTQCVPQLFGWTELLR